MTQPKMSSDVKRTHVAALKKVKRGSNSGMSLNNYWSLANPQPRKKPAP